MTVRRTEEGQETILSVGECSGEFPEVAVMSLHNTTEVKCQTGLLFNLFKVLLKHVFDSHPRKIPDVGPPSPFFHHVFFTLTSNINCLVFFKLEHFLRPFLKTRRYDKCVYTFGSSYCPKKGKYFLLLIFLTTKIIIKIKLSCGQMALIIFFGDICSLN